MNKKTARLELFGELLRKKREENRIGLREICRKVKFDPSNWSKIERGKLSPPSDQETLSLWALALGIKRGSDEYHSFIDLALIAQNIIPQVLTEEEMLKLLPAFFRTARNEKPTKQEIDHLIKLIKETLS
jgi:transcriptional regulator with XRE-family HTH domain